MARIAGVELNDSWRVDYALTNIKGIGWSLSKKILGELKYDADKRVSKLSSEEIAKIGSKLEGLAIEGELIRQVKSNIARLREIGSYKGVRHSRGLPARGQRTKTNARTKRGKRKTVGAYKKSELAKQTQPQKE